MVTVGQDEVNFVFDLDEVLCSQVAHVHEAARARNLGRARQLDFSDYQSLNYSQLWGVSPRVAHEFVIDYLGHNSRSLQLVPGADESLRRLKDFAQRQVKRARFHVLTSRSVRLKTATEDQINYRFPGIFDSITLTGNADPIPPEHSKPYWYRRLRGDAMVDDGIGSVEECVQGFGGQGVVFGYYPWNQSGLLVPTASGGPLVRCGNWPETEQLLMQTFH